MLLAVLSLAAFGQWWLLPRLDDHRDMLAEALGDYLRVPVRLGAVSAVRDGWRLGLRLRGVELRDPARDAALASFSKAVVTLNLWRSLRDWRPVVGRIRLEGADLTLEQGADGVPHLLGRTDGAATATPLPEVARWLFALPRLEIVGERLAVRRPDGLVLQLAHPYLQLQRTAGSQRLDFTAELPAGSGNRVRLAVDRQGEAGSEQGRGAFELHLDRLDLAGSPSPLPFGAGQAAVELTGDWRDWRPVQLGGRLRLLRAEPPAEPRFDRLKNWLVGWPEIEARFDWRRRNDGWDLRGETHLAGGEGQTARRPTFELSRTEAGWRGTLRQSRAEDWLAWATPWLDEAARRWLVPLDPRGELPDIDFRAGADTADYAVTARLAGVSLQTVHGLPGFDHLAGTLEMTPDGGRLDLDSRRVRVDTAGLLRAPFTLDRLAGAVSWQRSPEELRLESAELTVANPDLNGRFQGRVTVPARGEPLLDIRGHYWDVRGDRARRYLPVAILDPEAVVWLDRALVGGRVVAGDVVFRGPPARFPFDGGEGLFETRFRVENGVVDYMPGWPRLEQGRATVTFRNRGMLVEGESGRLLDGEVEDFAVRIDDFERAVIRAKGRAKGAGASMWRALEASPAGRALGEDLPSLRIEGANTLDLELTIPLDSRPMQMRGRVGLLGNNVSLPAWKIALGRARGEVRFTESDLGAGKVQAVLRGEPIQLDLDLVGREGRRELRVRLGGRLGLQALLGEPATALEPYLDGKSVWKAELLVPTRLRERRAVPAFTLSLDSDLRGIAIRLPAPLGKPADEARPLRIGLQPAGEGERLRATLEYGPVVRAALELRDYSRQPQFERGELRIGAGPATLPEGSGLTVIAHLPRWEPKMPAGPPGAADGGGTRVQQRAVATDDLGPLQFDAMSLLRGVEARIGDLVIGGRSFGSVTLQASRQQDGTRIEWEGSSLAGRVTVPDRPTPQEPVNAALSRLHVGPAIERPRDHAPFAQLDPRRLPPLVLTVAELRIGRASLGRLRLIAEPRPDGIRLKDIRLESERQRIDATGEWRSTGTGQASGLKATLQGAALADTLAAFGYPGSGVERGATRADLAVEWGAALTDFDLERLRGTLKFEVGPGQLRDINPGLGRMIGMLNVQNLTRRLSFDFSDLFQPGMGFDRIAGEFAFKHGSAHTENAQIEAPAARIQIEGRVGLLARDYDLTVTVVPHFGGTLPVAGAIAGGPAVGAAVFVAERLLQKGIEHATRYRYALKNSWDQPVMEPLREPPAPAQTKGFASDN
jgi:uncharacterized protein (TIGR02099 family)